ncbi:DoxX family protein [Dyadobacter sp. NIV53]|uniref:DoxX family protein n=1 Tax=Dyadobacter sp. NIV53 TaxID=2861765 RepID=UPI001C86F7CC|nr:DoxX family protein [Dyadobacter sp. NIV53]
MKKNRIIYWVTTGIVGAMMLFSAYSYFTNPEVGAGFHHLGFPDYFRIELALAKILGALVLLIPFVPARIKEWAYAGFGITFISAAIAHINSNDATPMIITPIVVLIILIVSNIYFHKQNESVLS